jgi:hypothetical protein
MLCVAGFGPARADLTAVLPVEGGTVGTLMTLMGSGFGAQRGTVQLGTERCQILSWADTIITCEVVSPQPAGDYTVKLLPHESKENAKPMTGSFSLMAPRITPGDPLRLVKPGDLVTIAGAFFGDKKGEVCLRDTPGDTVAAKVRHWSMDSISFEVPKGLKGYLALSVANEVGLDIQPLWGTLTPVPPGAAAQPDIEVCDFTDGNASGVYFNGALWVFYLYHQTSGSKVYDAIQVGRYTNGALVAAPPCGGKTYATVVPLVISHELWAFCTALDGELCYKRFLITSNAWENGEGSWNRIGSLTTDSNHEIAPAYNSISNRLEVYYHYNNTIYWTVSEDRGLNWSGGQPVAGIINAVSAPSAVFYQQTETNGVTLLAAGIQDASGVVRPTVFWVKNGAVVQSRGIDTSLHGRPFLADLGEDYLALIWTTANNTQPQMKKVNKHTGEWLPTYTPLAKNTIWPPNLAVSYEQQTDTNSSLRICWNANTYLFWGNQPSKAYVPVETMSSIEELGYWQEDGPPTRTNFGLDVTNCFQFWSVLGVVDAPPFIVNGDEEYKDNPSTETNPTRAEFGTEQSNTVESTTRWSVGPYIQTGEKSPIKIETSYSYAEEHASGLETTFTFGTTLYRGTNSPVMVYYLAPEVEVHHVQWHSADPTINYTNYMYPVLFTANTSYQCYSFDPTTLPVPWTNDMPATYFDLTNFPVHKQADDWARLATYPTPTNAFWTNYWFDGIRNWMNSQGDHVYWASTTTTNSSTSNSVEYKVGGMIKKRLGFGVEGSWEAKTETATTITTAAAVWFENPFPGPITHFSVDARWLGPDPRGYWVPVNRKGMGDTPWFITYAVGNVW